MFKKTPYIFAFLLILVALTACKSNTAFTRSMYGLTTKYNIHFNGNEAYKEGLAKMEQNYDDDYSHQLMLHPVYSLVDLKEPRMDADFDRAIDKCKKSIQTKSISTKPKRKEKNSKEYRDWLNRGEWNPFIHNAWVLSGKAQFFEGDFNSAQATFAYTIRHFNWKPQVIAECHIWTARCYAVQGFLYDAETELGLVDEKILSPRLQKEYALAKAEIILQRGENKHEAISYLTKANKVWQTKEQRLRAQFLIAQLYEGNGDLTKAYEGYGKIVRSASNYKTQFNARIAQTRVMPVSDLSKTEKKLQSYRRQKRNSEYLDQVYYALGNVALLQRDTTKAIRQYELALEESTRNGMDKAVAALRLGEICFEQEDYVKAQKAYSMAMSIIKDDYQNYKEIARLSSVLDELQTHAETVQLQDSILWLASLPESDLNKVIDKIIEDLVKKEKEAEEKENLEQYNERIAENADPLAPNTIQPIVGQKDDSWYFYNPAVVSAGKAEFQRIWGSRRPEDNWRRKNKTEVYLGDITEEDKDTEENKEFLVSNDSIDTQRSEGAKVDNSADISDPHKREYYLAQIPFTDAQKENSNTLIEDGMYNMGVIINEKLENFPLSIHTFENLEKRYPESNYRLEFYYSIYLMYMRMGQKSNAEVYRQKLMQKFPESAYAVAVSDPNYIENLRHMEVAQDSLYRKTYEAYLANESEDVHKNYEWVHEHWPLSKLMPKFLFLHALSYVQDGDTDSFRESLEQLTALYPKSDVSPLAGQMVKGIHEGRNVQTGETAKGIEWKNTLLSIEEPLDNDSTMQIIDDPDAPHVLLIIYNKEDISQNDLLFEIAKFNFENYLIKDFDLEIIDRTEYSILVISSFENLDELLDYHDRINDSKTLVLPEGIEMIDISVDKFRSLLLKSGT